MTASIDSVVRGLLLRHHLWQALGTVLGHTLGVALVLLAVDAWLPVVLTAALWAGAGWLAYVLLRELLRLLLGRRQLRVRDVDRGLQLQDMLTTWWHCRRRQDVLVDWLRCDVSRRLQQIPARPRRRLWRGACLRALVLLPLVVLLVWLGPLGQLLPVGLEPGGDGSSAQRQQATGKAETTAEGSAKQERTAAGAGKVARQERDEARESTRREQANQPKPAGDRAGEAPEPKEVAPPKPLIAALPVQREFVVPTWIHEGPSTKARAPVVEVPRPESQPPDQAQPPRRRADPTPPEPALVLRFQRAAERAQHARHVPPAERPFVRRYFGELVGSGQRR